MTDILINAPKIKVLEFFSSTSRRTYFIENAPAVEEARLSFDEMFAEATIRMIHPYGTERKLERLLENFQAAKELHLCGVCIQVSYFLIFCLLKASYISVILSLTHTYTQFFFMPTAVFCLCD